MDCEENGEKSSSEMSTNQNDFAPRPYQTELSNYALKNNTIVVLGTGSGKTYISILLIKELANQIHGSYPEFKRTIFVVNTVALVYQQAEAIRRHTSLKVGQYEGSMGVDFWSDEEWREEICNHEVLVFVAQIFFDLLTHARISMKNVNLLVMDECHHATGNHPMREIMRQYFECKKEDKEVPKVLGLTACVIHKKIPNHKVEPQIKELEIVMDSVLYTASDQNHVKRCTTRPTEMFVFYDEKVLTPYQERVIERLNEILKSLNEYDPDERTYKKSIALCKKHIKNIAITMTSLGEWCCSRAINYHMKHFKEMKETEEVPFISSMLNKIFDELNDVAKYCSAAEENFQNPREHISNKVKRFLEILDNCNDKKASVLVFVDKRNTAKLLYDLIEYLRTTNNQFASLKGAGYAIGGNGFSNRDFHLNVLEQKRMKETLNKFRKEEYKVIVSTSVLEEGIDVRKCNVVLRFDRPITYRSYVQSRGRARAVPSWYVLLEKHLEKKSLFDDVELFQTIEKVLNSICRDRINPTMLDMEKHFSSDELLLPYVPYGTQGPKVTMNSCLQLVNRFCGNLPQDKFSNLVVDVKMMQVKGGGVKCGLLLPINSPFRERVWGDPMNQNELAKKSAALKLCEILHKQKLLNDNLFPIKNHDGLVVNNLLGLPEEKVEKGQPSAGTRARKQIYKKQIFNGLAENKDAMCLYVLNVNHISPIKEEINLNSEKFQRIGFLASPNLYIPSFTLNHQKWGTACVTIQSIGMIQMVPAKLSNIHYFHKNIFIALLKINEYLFEFLPHKSGIFIVPVDENCNIDFHLINQMKKSFPRSKNDSSSICKVYENYKQSSVLRKTYSDEQDELYFVAEVMPDLNPLSEFPENKKLYKTYFDYYDQMYGIKIKDLNQKLLRVKHLPKEFNYIKPIVLKKNLSHNRRDTYLVPELCYEIPVKVELWWQITLIPSVLYRINGLNNASHLLDMVGITFDKTSTHLFDLNWLEHDLNNAFRNSYDNLIIGLQNKTRRSILPDMILQSITTKNACEEFDLERLEVLGDAYLKFSMSNYLFIKYQNDHEGFLTEKRSNLVSNKTLYQLAKVKGIADIMSHCHLNPPINGFLPGFYIKQHHEDLMRSSGLHFEKWKTNDGEAALLSQSEDISESLPTEYCYNPWKEMVINDKFVADCIESIIGCFLLHGEVYAKIFMTWLGYPNVSLEVPVKSQNSQIINKYYQQGCLDNLEQVLGYTFKNRYFIVEAVTHSSYTKNKETGCYQRLEFIGDAVLDYLVTGFVFLNNENPSPGKMTDMRSYLVKNETLAEIAVKFGLHKHMFHMSPLLQTTIDKFMIMLQDDEKEFNTEDDTNTIEDIEVPKALGDLVEAVIGAIYIDSNFSLQIVWNVILKLFSEQFNQVADDLPINPIRELYEIDNSVTFEKVQAEDDKESQIIVRTNKLTMPIVGIGKNFRVAKNAAAKLALYHLKQKCL